jgi:hypothetical protein
MGIAAKVLNCNKHGQSARQRIAAMAARRNMAGEQRKNLVA